jgi:hypothetical protein
VRRVGHETVQTPIGHRHHHGNHFPIGSRQVFTRHVQLFEVAEPSAKVIDPKREGLKHIRNETQCRFSLTKQLGHILGQLASFSNRVPTDFTIITHALTLRRGLAATKPLLAATETNLWRY